MVNIEWKENGNTRYENLLSENSVEDFVEGLKNRGCTNIVVTNNIEKVMAGLIKKYNSPKIKR